MREPVALGPNGVNFATRSASPHVAISPENVSPAIVDHQMKIGAGAPEAFLNLDGQQAQGDEDCSMDVVEPPNHQQAQSTTQLQTTPEAADIGPNNIGPQTTALSAAVAVDGGVCAGCGNADSRATGICEHCGGPVDPTNQSRHFHFGEWHIGYDQVQLQCWEDRDRLLLKLMIEMTQGTKFIDDVSSGVPYSTVAPLQVRNVAIGGEQRAYVIFATSHVVAALLATPAAALLLERIGVSLMTVDEYKAVLTTTDDTVGSQVTDVTEAEREGRMMVIWGTVPMTE